MGSKRSSFGRIKREMKFDMRKYNPFTARIEAGKKLRELENTEMKSKFPVRFFTITDIHFE
jgi:hypothetical protein